MRDQAAAPPASKISAMQKRIDALQASNDKLAREMQQLGPKRSDNSDEQPIIIEDDPELAKVKLIREQIKAVNGMADCSSTTALLQQSRDQKLAALEKDLQAALAAQRCSKPLAAQHAQLEAHLRRLSKVHETATSKLASAQATLEQAQLELNTQLAAVAESQARIEEAKKSAADIASRMAAEFGGAAAPMPSKFLPGSPEWGAIGEMLRIAGNPEVQAALRGCGFAEGHLQSLNHSIAVVQAAGAEQARQANDGGSGGTLARSAEALVAEGNKAQMQAEVDALKAKHAAELETLQATHTSVSPTPIGAPDDAHSRIAAGTEDAEAVSKRQRLSNEPPALQDFT